MGSHALLQEIFLTQVSNICLLCLLNWQEGSLPAAPPGSLYIHSPGHVRCFCVLAIMNTEVHASFQSRMYSRCMPRSWIAGSYGSFILFLFFFLETCILFSIAATPIDVVKQWCTRVPHQHLLFITYF